MSNDNSNKGNGRQNNDRKQKRKFEPPTFVKEFAGERVAVRVAAKSGHRPLFSLHLGAIVRDADPKKPPRYYSGINVRTSITNARVSIQSIRDEVNALLTEAEAWIEEKSQERENEILDEKIAREERDLARNKPKVRHGLGTLNKAESKKPSTEAAPAAEPAKAG